MLDYEDSASRQFNNGSFQSIQSIVGLKMSYNPTVYSWPVRPDQHYSMQQTGSVNIGKLSAIMLSGY